MNQFILVDCNNFFVSCQRLFNPALEGRPVLVLSSNDGCVIARSQETKQLGIPMGEPFFKVKQFCIDRGITVFSSNFKLYSDISSRVMTILSQMTEEIQIYSIDEAFLVLSDGEDLFRFCQQVRTKIKTWVGIPTSIGIAPTKTLAKVANYLAKKDRSVGVVDLRLVDQQKKALAQLPVGEVWGIGRQFAARLHRLGIYTAEDLVQNDPSFIRKKFGVVGERLLWELRGVSCLVLEDAAPKQSITCSRSFGNRVTTKEEMYEAIATYASSAAFKLREQDCLVKVIHVFVLQSGEDKVASRMTSCTFTLKAPTDHTSKIISAAKQCIDYLFKEGLTYKKCGITLLDFTRGDQVVPDLFDSQECSASNLMPVMDQINARYGKNAIFLAAMGMKHPWETRCRLRTGSHTTSWQELAIAKAI